MQAVKNLVNPKSGHSHKKLASLICELSNIDTVCNCVNKCWRILNL